MMRRIIEKRLLNLDVVSFRGIRNLILLNAGAPIMSHWICGIRMMDNDD